MRIAKTILFAATSYRALGVNRRHLHHPRLEQPGHALHGQRLLGLHRPAALQHHRGPAHRRRQAGHQRRRLHRHLPGGGRPVRLDQHHLHRQGQFLHLHALPLRSARAGHRAWPAGPCRARPTSRKPTSSRPSTSLSHGVFTPVNWWRAEGIPISPYDDALQKNPYPLMRMIAWNSANQPIATNDVVLPVSDEMDCRACHASGTQAAAQPAAGWVWDGLPERDYRLNILRLHDERQFAQHAGALRGGAGGQQLQPGGALPPGHRRRQAGPLRPLPCLRGAANRRLPRRPAADHLRPFLPRQCHGPGVEHHPGQRR